MCNFLLTCCTVSSTRCIRESVSSTTHAFVKKAHYHCHSHNNKHTHPQENKHTNTHTYICIYMCVFPLHTSTHKDLRASTHTEEHKHTHKHKNTFTQRDRDRDREIHAHTGSTHQQRQHSLRRYAVSNRRPLHPRRQSVPTTHKRTHTE